MKKLMLLAAAAMLAVSAGVPAYAQMADHNGAMNDGSMNNHSMNSDAAVKMTASQKRTLSRCNAMSHDAMMKNRSCKRMMKMHPDMMQGDSTGH